MKFTCTVDIDLPLERVIDLFDDPENMQYWQDGFVSFKHKSGVPGMPGSQSVITYEMRGKQFELLETVKERELPFVLKGSYEGDWGANDMDNYFESLNPNKTRWNAEVTYYKMNGFMMNLMRLIFPSMFKKQTQKWLDQFKVFAENQS